MGSKVAERRKDGQAERQREGQTAQPWVVSYLRFSTPEQLKGDSQRRQFELSQKWAAEQGLTVAENLSDLGVSAFRGKNQHEGALGAFLRLVELGSIPQGTILLVEELDRISRQSPEEALHLFLGIVRSGVIVVTLNTGDRFERGKIDMGKLMIAVVKFCTAHDESAKKSFRLTETYANKRKKASNSNHTVHSHMPSWIRLDGDLNTGKRLATAEGVKAVKAIFAMALEGHGATYICREMNSGKYPIIVPSGQYTRCYVIELLKNRAVLGEYHPTKVTWVETASGGKKRKRVTQEVIKGYYPQIVSEDEFNAARSGLRGRRMGGGRISGYVNLFRGLLFSALDGSSLVITDKGVGKRYVPSAMMEKRSSAVDMPSLPVHLLEQGLLFRLADPQLFVKGNQGEKVKGIHLEIESANEQLHQLTLRAKQISDSLLTNAAADTDSVLRLLNDIDTKKKETANRVEDLRAQVATLNRGGGNQLTEMFALLERHRNGTLNDEKRRELANVIRQYVERIDVYVERIAFDRVIGCDILMRDGRQLPPFMYRAHWQNRKGQGRGNKSQVYQLEILVKGKKGDGSDDSSLMLPCPE